MGRGSPELIALDADFRCWHLADMLSVVIRSAFDPKRTLPIPEDVAPRSI